MSGEREIPLARQHNKSSPTAYFADLSLHYVGDEALLLDRARQRLYALNACAGFIWTSLKDGKSPVEVSRSLNEQFRVPANAAVSYVAGVLRQYAALVSDAKPSVAESTMPARGKRRDPRAPTVETYSLLDRIFRVTYDGADLSARIHPLLQHRTHGGSPAGSDAIDIAVLHENGGVAVTVDQDLAASCDTIGEAAVTVRACLTQHAVMRSGGLCAVHAGALCRAGRALLLPGDAGYGKSTLSAGLAAHGFEMLCDDTALIAGRPLLVRSLPAGLCIKRGAYAVLESSYPQLPSLPEWRRPDGKRVRYLMPGRHVAWADADVALPVAWIVFPRYGPDQRTGLLPLPKHEALARLLRGVHVLSGALDEQTLDALIDWIEQIDCFELPLSSLHAAVALVDELCR
jgi:hypothetical protein